MLNCSNQRRTKKKKKKMERQSLFLDRLNIVKLSALSSLIYRVNVPPIKLPASYKLILNIMWKGKRQRIANTEGEEHSWKTDITQLQDLL